MSAKDIRRSFLGRFYERTFDSCDDFAADYEGASLDVEDRLVAKLPELAGGLSSEVEQIVYRAATKAAATKFIDLAAIVLRGDVVGRR